MLPVYFNHAIERPEFGPQPQNLKKNIVSDLIFDELNELK
jgi:hypothetical protein